MERLLIFLLFFWSVSAQHQYFIVRPTNQSFIEGTTALLHCQVGNRNDADTQPRVQWTKNGFAMGFDRHLPGYPRYKMIGNSSEGINNLQIEDVNLSDDAEYQCQVLPYNGHALRAPAVLTVLIAPNSTELLVWVNDQPRQPDANNRVEMRERDSVKLKCTAHFSKPAATLVWLRNSSVQHLDVNRELKSETTKLDTISEEVILQPTADDNRAVYKCEAKHNALPIPDQKAVQFSVLYPPGEPIIQGPSLGEMVQKNESVSLQCRARGGNPLADLYWFRNNQKIDTTYRQKYGFEAINTYQFIAREEDNNALFRCEARNKVSLTTKTASITIPVYFAPAHIRIQGSKEAREGETVSMSCKTSAANPCARLSWVVDGDARQVQKSPPVMTTNGACVTEANVTLQVPNVQRNMMFSCYAFSDELGKTNVETQMLSVLYPPQEPTIIGNDDNQFMEVGTLQRITCLAMGGNPKPTLKWYKGDKTLKESIAERENVVSAEIAIEVDESDNGAVYRCEMSHPALHLPITVNTTLNVYFPPKEVRITTEPEVLKEGEQAILTCETAPSNPTAKVTWYQNHQVKKPIEERSIVASGPGRGWITISKIAVEMTRDVHAAQFTCEAENEEIRQSTHYALQLNIRYKPYFISKPEAVIGIPEHSSKVINVTAVANPADISYAWTKNGEAIPQGGANVTADGAVLNLTGVRKADSGNYELEATNEEGSSKLTVQLNIQYEPIVTKTNSPIHVAEYEDARLTCEVDANPAKEDMIKWERDGFSMDTRTESTTDTSSGKLLVKNVTRADYGNFLCTAENGIGDKVSKEVLLVVNYAPVVDPSPLYLKFAADEGEVAKLKCRMNGSPQIDFTWFKSGVPIRAEEDKYKLKHQKIDEVVWESTLSVSSVLASDYGMYVCIGKNPLGEGRTNSTLGGTTRPDSPLLLNIVNVTHDAITISWVPGFSGGIMQFFRVRYKKDIRDGYTYVDVFPANRTTFTIPGLELGTMYYLSIMAYNSKGESGYKKDELATTSSTPPPTSATSRDPSHNVAELSRVVIIAITVVGTALLVLNVIIISCFIRRRRSKRFTASDHGSSKSGTIEMYAPSTYNETVTGETLSSISEKSENYIHEDSVDDYPFQEETGKMAQSTYLIDNLEPPPQYGGYRSSSSRAATLSRTSRPSRFECSDEYAEQLRRNTYNHRLGNKMGYGKPSPQEVHIGPGDPYPHSIPNEERYVSYPPQKYGHHTPHHTPNGSCVEVLPVRNGAPPQMNVMPPVGDVRTGQSLSTFSAGGSPLPSLEDGGPHIQGEGHLV